MNASRFDKVDVDQDMNTHNDCQLLISLLGQSILIKKPDDTFVNHEDPKSMKLSIILKLFSQQ